MKKLLEQQISELLIKQKRTLAITESCTGGLLGDTITNVSGSSNYFLGGIIVYHNKIKQNIVGVQETTIKKFGAVSEETVKELSSNIRKMFGSDIGIAITGIAGPMGGSVKKPVGFTWIGLATEKEIITRNFIWEGDRITNKKNSTQAALRMLKEFLKR